MFSKQKIEKQEKPTEYHSGIKWVLPVIIGGSFLVLGTIVYLIVKK